MPNLKKDFINALKSLSLPPLKRKRLNLSINAIRMATIPQTNYLQVLGFILLLMKEMPVVRKSTSNNLPLKKLKKLCLDNIDQDQLENIQPVSSMRRKNKFD